MKEKIEKKPFILQDAEKLVNEEMRNVKGGNALAGCTCKRTCQVCQSGFMNGAKTNEKTEEE